MNHSWVSDLKLEQFVLEELTDKEMATIRSQVDNDEALRTRIHVITVGNEQFEQRFPPAEFLAQVRTRANKSEATETRSMWTRPWAWGPSLAIAVAMLFVLLLPQEPDSSFRLKGVQAHLVAHRVDGDDIELLVAGEQAREGERIQLSVVGAQGMHLVVFSIDGDGLVTLHYPQKGENILWTEQAASLPRSYELDDAPQFERFFLLTQDEPIDVPAVLDAAEAFSEREDVREADFDAFDEGMEASSFILEKGEGE